MLYKPYGKTGKKISVIGFGGMRFKNPEDIDANAELVVHAFNQGINYFDTAPSYCKNKSEQIIGAAVKQLPREKIYISTKSNKADGDALRADLEQSLRRLGVDKIDFFHIWWVLSLEAWRQRKAGGGVDAAIKAKEEGLIEHLAISSHMPSDELCQALSEAPFDGVTLGYCAINFPYRQHAIEQAHRRGLGVVTMNPLGGGLIPQNAERFDFIRGPDDPDVVTAALRFNVSNPNVTSALVGFTTRQHIDQAVAAVADFRPYDAEHIDAMRRKILDSFEGLCTGCSYCLPCPQDVPIPKLMDAYNMRILQGDDPKHIRNRLKWHWALTTAAAEACNECGTCEERCTQHLPIRERIKAIAEIPPEDENPDG